MTFFLSNFRKNYISVIQKWLLRNSETNIKESLENKFNFNPDTEKLMEILNVKTPQDGLRKLFKLFSSIFKINFKVLFKFLLALFELHITKLSELEMVSLVKYDENFSSFIKTSAFSQVNQLTAGNKLYNLIDIFPRN